MSIIFCQTSGIIRHQGNYGMKNSIGGGRQRMERGLICIFFPQLIATCAAAKEVCMISQYYASLTRLSLKVGEGLRREPSKFQHNTRARKVW